MIEKGDPHQSFIQGLVITPSTVEEQQRLTAGKLFQVIETDEQQANGRRREHDSD